VNDVSALAATQRIRRIAAAISADNLHLYLDIQCGIRCQDFILCNANAVGWPDCCVFVILSWGGSNNGTAFGYKIRQADFYRSGRQDLC